MMSPRSAPLHTTHTPSLSCKKTSFFTLKKSNKFHDFVENHHNALYTLYQNASPNDMTHKAHTKTKKSAVTNLTID